MSNITLFNSNKLPAHIAALAANLPEENDEFGGSGPHLPTLSIRGKEFRFRMNGQEQATGLRDMECIIVRRRERTSRRYFAEKYKSGSVEQPNCHSIDGIKPDRGTDIQSETCQTCPHSAWGSKVNESGALGFACDSYKMLVLAPFMGDELAEQPVMLNLPATSIKRSKKDTGNVMHFAEYVAALKQHNVPAIGVVTRLKFTSDEFPRIAFEFVRFAAEEEVEAAMRMRDLEDVTAAVEGTLVEESAPIVEAEEPVIAPKKPKAKPAPVEKDEEAAPPPKVTKKAVVVEDEPEAEAPPANSEDAMAAVRRLLAGKK